MTSIQDQAKDIKKHIESIYPGFTTFISATYWANSNKTEFTVGLYKGDQRLRLVDEYSLTSRSYEELINHKPIKGVADD